MISFNNDGITVKSEPTITFYGTIQIGGLEAPYKSVYDLTNIPGKWHYLFIQAIQGQGR